MVESRIRNRPNFRRRIPQYVAVIAGCLGGFSLGCWLGWAGPCYDLLRLAPRNFDVRGSMLIASMAPLLGATIGAIFALVLVDTIGRKWTTMITTSPYVLGWLLVVLAGDTIGLYVAGRIVTGICSGVFTVVAPLYSAEIAEKEIRGTLAGLFQLSIALGVFFGHCVGFTGDIVWISVLCGLVSGFIGSAAVFVPESALFHMIKGKQEAARVSVIFYRGRHYNVEAEIEELKRQLGTSNSQRRLAILKDKPAMKALGVVCALMLFQQLSGVSAIIFHGTAILATASARIYPAVQMLIVTLAQVVSCVVSALLVDKIGRKALLIISEGLMFFSLGAFATFFFLESHQYLNAENFWWLPFCFTCCYIFFYSLGCGPIPWLYASEIFPGKLRSTAGCVASFVNWSTAFLVIVLYERLVRIFGLVVVLLAIAAISLLAAIFAALFVLETKDKDLIEIQKELGVYPMENERRESL